MTYQPDIFDNGSASQFGERQTDLEELIAEKKANEMRFTMEYSKWEQSEINVLKHYHGAAKTNAEFAEILRIKVKNMEQDQWSRPSNTRAARIMDYDILILKLSKDTVDNAA